MSPRHPLRIINSTAPMRICDNGGWTDTWFAQHGRVFSIAVAPRAEVQLRIFQGDTTAATGGNGGGLTIYAENYGERYQPRRIHGIYDKHPLLEAAIELMQIPHNLDLEVSIFSEAPAGCSTGTSAAVSVALIGALHHLISPHTPLSPHDAARTAHRIETELLGQQCGIQDQLASAFGGINLIDMPAYPQSTVTPIPLPDSLWWELESRLSLIYVGSSHQSSAVHLKVIRQLEDEGPDSPRLAPLRATADASVQALTRGDFKALGQTMIANTNSQSNLHPDLIGPAHQQVIAIAQQFGVLGYKVNGAGGTGGSVTLLSNSEFAQKRALLRALEQANSNLRPIPISLARQGLRVWEPGL